MKTVAVIGLGIMGRGIAKNFLKNGYRVLVWNRTFEKSKELVGMGAILAKSVAEAVKESDYVFEVTANDESSKDVWTGDCGILSSASPRQCLITCATLSVKWTDELARLCKNQGFKFLDMPMTGGRAGAESGQLILLTGGDETILTEISKDLEAISKEVKYFGEAGSGMRFKLILNALQAIHIIGLGEMLKIAKTVGLNQKAVGDALAERPGGISTQIAWDGYQEEPSSINFSIEWIAKDLGYARKMSDNIKSPLLDEARMTYLEAIEKGFGQIDWTQINKI